MHHHRFVVLLCARSPFDQLGFRRACKAAAIACELHQVTSLPALQEWIGDAEERQVDVALVDYRDPDGSRYAATLLVDSAVPVIGIVEGGESDQVVLEEMRQGVSAVVRADSPLMMDFLVLHVGTLASRRVQTAEFDRFRERIAHLKRERQALLNASLTLITYHVNDGVIAWSNAYEPDGEVNGVDYLKGRKPEEIWKHGGLRNGKCPVTTALTTGQAAEAEVTTLDGYVMLQRAYPLVDEDGTVVGAMASTLDMSAVSPAQEALRTAARMQAAATLAGGIAHKFNNLMAAVLGNASLARQDLDPDHPVVDLLAEIEQSARVAGELSDQLLAFARGGKYMTRAIRLNDVVSETLQVEMRRVPAHVRLETRLDPDLWPVEANTAQMGLVVGQLVVNAVEAIEAAKAGSGTVRVETDNHVVTDAAHSDTPWLVDGRYVRLRVSDDGCGMTEAVRKRVFEPFFTTKKKGRGLGLTGVYGIVRSHEGHVLIESEPGRGTTVSVHLPVAQVSTVPVEPAAVAPSPAPQVVQLARGEETVLVVDDERVVRRSVARLLSRLGYTVLEAASGDEAVSVARSSTGPIHVTILDMIMPGKDGIATYRALRELHPDMAVIAMSGYDRETYADALLEAGMEAFLQKPVPVEVIAATVREVLDKERASTDA